MSRPGFRQLWRRARRADRWGGLPRPHVLAAALHTACGALVILLLPALPETADRRAVAGLASLALVLAEVIAVLPWSRWRPGAARWLIPESLTLVALFNLTARDLSLHSLFYFVVWGWVGLTQRPGTATRFGPLLAAAYLVPAATATDPDAIVRSSLFVVPVCVVVGEAVSLVAEQLRRSERDVAASEARYSSLLRHASEFIVVFGLDRRIRFANAAFERMVGLRGDALRAVRASSLVHPDDREGAIAWFRSVASTSDPEVFRFRILHEAGGWRVVEASITDLLGDETVGGILLSGRDVTDRDAAESVLHAAARTDPLTMLGNRAAFEEAVAALGQGTPVSLLFLDVDGFKVVNDSLGHTTGDRLLVQISRRIRERVEVGTLCRTGGDEFVLVLAGGEAGAGEAAAALVVQSLAEPFEVDGRPLRVAVSIGIAEGDGSLSAEELLRRADLAMYRAKSEGGGRWSVFDDDLAARAERRMQIESELRVALHEGQLLLEYQPVVDVATLRTVKAEALVRWDHPVRGCLAPDEFLDVADESGLMVELGAWVLEESLRSCAEWQAAGHRVGVAVNVSPVQLDMGFVGTVASGLRRHGIAGRDLWLEITEHSLLDVDGCEAVLTALRELDVWLAIDDFGTGYSSLSYLHRLDVDALKIDRSFLGAGAAGDQPGLVAAIIDVARHLRLRTVGEGVETAAQLELLRSLGCDLAQGFHLALPMPGADLLARLGRERTAGSPQTWRSRDADVDAPGPQRHCGGADQRTGIAEPGGDHERAGRELEVAEPIDL